MDNDWLYRYKRRIVLGIIGILAVSMAVTVLIIILVLRTNLLDINAQNARLLGSSVTAALKNNMLLRSPEMIQSTITEIGSGRNIARIFIFDKNGKIAFSTDKDEIGTAISNLDGLTCKECHAGQKPLSFSITFVLKTDKGDVNRNVTVIPNEPSCHACHSPSDRINGKLVIDYSLAPTYGMIGAIEAVILISGAFCLVLIVPFLSRMINRYIDQLILKNQEINLVYSIINSISKTIDMEELKSIVLDIASDTFDADEVDIVTPKGKKDFRLVSRTVSGEKKPRVELAPDGKVARVIDRWLNGQLKDHEISPERDEIYLPIEKGDHRLALLIVRCCRRPFQDERLALVGAICNHIAIAFENARLYRIAITDDLTNLFTVRYFRTCMDRNQTNFEKYGEKFALLMMDIDNFKIVNDTYGHVAGDEVLKKVAACILDSIRSIDLAFRYGGEEFTLILPSTGIHGGQYVAERIRASVAAAEVMVNDIPMKFTISIGISVCPENALMVKDLMLEADKALYVAKRSGKNRVVLSSRKTESARSIGAPSSAMNVPQQDQLEIF